MEALETKEKVEAAVEGHGAGGSNRRIGLVIAILAALLALTEAGGKSAQTEALNANVRATDLWAFFQAKTIRRAIVQTAMETARLELAREQTPEAKAVIQ